MAFRLKRPRENGASSSDSDECQRKQQRLDGNKSPPIMRVPTTAREVIIAVVRDRYCSTDIKYNIEL